MFRTLLACLLVLAALAGCTEFWTQIQGQHGTKIGVDPPADRGGGGGED